MVDRTRDELTELEQLMRTAPYTVTVSPVRSATGEHHGRVRLAGTNLVLIGKPAFAVHGPRIHLSQHQAVQSVHNEAAAWVVARQLGVTHLVPVTIVRQMTWPVLGPVVASLQVPWPPPNGRTPPLRQLNRDHVTQAAVFDTLIRHTDRGRHKNWDVGVGVPAPVRLFDNAFSLGVPEWAFTGQTSYFYGARCGTPLPTDMVQGLENVIALNGEGLHELVPAQEITSLLTRAKRMIDLGEIAA